MLCRKFRQIFYNKSNWNNNIQHFLISTRLSKKCVSVDGFWAAYRSDKAMSSVRFVLKDLSIMRIWSAWRRSYFVSTVVRRCRKDRGVRDVIHRFRHSILRPRQTLLLSATAAYKAHRDDPESPPNSEKNITDEELQELLKELENVNELSRNTLFCTSCGRRLVIDKKLSGVSYCSCKDCKPSEDLSEGWEPYMEAEDVIVWRKQFKPGQPYYAYKVYGRYKELQAQDFAAVQVDGAYRRVWDSAVASLSVVEKQANGVDDQTVLHWEVLWPRLFANRDYVYIRRHKEFDIDHTPASPLAAPATASASSTASAPVYDTQRPSVHSHAKRKAMENALKDAYLERDESTATSNKVYIIASRSCDHSNVPESKHAIRVADFWSHMVIKTLDGPDKPGMEFVLTYYEEPAVGGLPSGVATWATGRAAPAFLERQRRAAAEYRAWRATRTHQDLPDYIPFGPETEANLDSKVKTAIREEDLESSKQGPELESEVTTHDQSTQTDMEKSTAVIAKVEAQDASVATDRILYVSETSPEKETEKPEQTNKNLESKSNTSIKVKDVEVKPSDVIQTESNKVDLKQNGDATAENGQQESEHIEKENETRSDKNESQNNEQGIKDKRNSEKHTQNDEKENLKGKQANQDGGFHKNDRNNAPDGGKEKQDGDKEKQDGGKEKQNGGKEKQDGDHGEEQKNSSWWRWFEIYST